MYSGDMSVVDRAILTRFPLDNVPIVSASDLKPPIEGADKTSSIGRGTFGEVFLNHLGSAAVAVKSQTIRKRSKDNHDYDTEKMISLNHFRTIKEAIVHLLVADHHSFPNCFGITDHESNPALVVEFLGDQETGVVYSLSKAIKIKFPTLANQEWLDVTDDILEGIRTMHERDLLHNDIKPNNVLLRRGRHRWHALIIDMGNVTAVDMPHCNRSLTEKEIEGYQLGVVYQHLAPEYVLELEHTNIQTDIYSLGKILHEVARITNNAELFNLASAMIDSKPHLRPSWRQINLEISQIKRKQRACV